MTSNNGVAIFEDFPANWELTTLGEVCKRGGGYVQTGPFGSQLHASDYVQEGIPTIMPINIGENQILTDGIARISERDAERLSRHRLEPGDVVFSRRGDVTRRALIREEEKGWLCGTGSLKIHFGKDVVNPLFASLYFGHPDVKDWIIRHAVGSTMPNLNGKIMEAIPFLLPPKKEQEKIARILGALDDKIELNRRMNHTLEEMARGLFKSWFVDFDPVTARSEGRVPFGMNAETASLFPAEFEETDEGSIPKGWKYVKLGEIMTNFDSRRVPLSGAQRLLRQGIYPYYGAASVMDYIDDYLFDGIYLLVGEDGSVEDSDGMAVTQYVWGKFWANNHAHVLQGINGISTEHLYLHYQFEPISPYVTGAVQPKVNQGNLNSMPFLLPSENVAEAFTKTVNPWFAKIRANQEEIKNLAAIRDALLPKLMSGEVRIKIS